MPGRLVSDECREFRVRREGDRWSPVGLGELAEPEDENDLGREVVVVQSAGFLSDQGEDRFTCNVTIGDGENAKFSFAVNPKHIVSKLTVYSVDGAHEEKEPHALLTVDRVDDRSVSIRVTEQTLNDLICKSGIEVGFQFGVVQRIGGNAQNCNIFVNNNYHGGPSGTPDANSSALVLFQHEIGHALGMVPEGHDYFYNNKTTAAGYGGEGDHCGFHTGLVHKIGALAKYGVLEDSKSPFLRVPSALLDGNEESGPCVMYHTRTRVHHLSKFCDQCKDVLRGSWLERKWGNWND